MASIKDQVKDLLSKGVAPATAATILKVSESYISQLMSDTQFRAEVQAALLKGATASYDRDAKIDAIEDRLLDKLEEEIEYLDGNPAKVLKAFQILNMAKRRSIGEGLSGGNVVNNIVQIALPAHLRRHAVEYEVNPRNEVIEVEGKTMATMPAHALTKIISKAEEGKSSADDIKWGHHTFSLRDLDIPDATNNVVDVFMNEEVGEMTSRGVDIIAEKYNVVRGEEDDGEF